MSGWDAMIQWEIRTKGLGTMATTKAIRISDEARAELTIARREMLARMERLDRSRSQLIRRIQAMNEILGPTDA